MELKHITLLALLGGRIFAFEQPVPTFTWLHKNIFQAKCATSCHQSVNPDGNVDFSSYKALIDSEGMLSKPIEPGLPEESGVWKQVSQKTMPKSGEKLSEEEIAAIYTWIKEGAKEN